MKLFRKTTSASASRQAAFSREVRMMNTILRLKRIAAIWRDQHGQDLIEYALMAGFVAVAAGAIMPGVANSISTIFSKVASVMTAAASQ